MLRSRRFDYAVVIKYLVLTLGFLLFSKLESEASIYSASLFAVSLSFGCSLILTPLLFLGCFFVLGKTGLLLSALAPALFLPAVFFIYRRLRAKPSFETVFYTVVSLAVFVFLGDTARAIPFEKRLITVGITALLTFLLSVSLRAITKKGLKVRLGYEELSAIFACVVALGVGVCNLISPILWKSVCVFTILTVCYVYRLGTATIISVVLGVPLAIFYGNLTYASVFLMYGLVAESLMPVSRHLSSVAVVLFDFVAQSVFGVYGSLDLYYIAPVAVGALAYSCIPRRPFELLKEKLLLFREKQLVRQSINRNRVLLSNRLYDLSTVFSDMANAFELFKKNAMSEESAKRLIVKELFSSTCKECENKRSCSVGNAESNELIKMLDVGFAKGKVSLIDFPEELGKKCGRPNNLLFGLNRLISDYRSYSKEKDTLNSGRELVAKEAEGVAEVLRTVAFESGTMLKYHSGLERKVTKELSKDGFLVEELLIYGEKENLSLSAVVMMSEFNLTRFTLLISGVLGQNMMLTGKYDVTEEKCYLTFKVSAKYDAVFGVASAKKDGSAVSGDTHSVIRLKEDKFLIALSDGMGSGKKAEKLSSVSLSLIESFYKAGLKSEVILSAVNRLLSFNEEDEFTALDVSVIDLKHGTADFIKYGSPYGFVVSKEGIKIVEGNSLPLGILNELRPSVSTTTVRAGDVILLVTDGVSDAFKNSTALIDFLRTRPAKNPKTLAEDVIARAESLSGGKHNDDMTALAVRIFKS